MDVSELPETVLAKLDEGLIEVLGKESGTIAVCVWWKDIDHEAAEREASRRMVEQYGDLPAVDTNSSDYVDDYLYSLYLANKRLIDERNQAMFQKLRLPADRVWLDPLGPLCTGYLYPQEICRIAADEDVTMIDYVPDEEDFETAVRFYDFTASDALTILQYSVGLIEEFDAGAPDYDLNGDGSINAADALLALQHSVRLITLMVPAR